MGTPDQWLEILATTKALFKAITAGADLAETLEKYRHDAATVSEARRVSQDDSTYSPEEIEAILTRLQGCRSRFIEQGGGIDRSRCLCSVLREAKAGNGGSIPSIDDWENIYRQLGCIRFEQATGLAH